MEGDDFHEAGGSGAALGRDNGVLQPGGAIIAQRAESGVAGGRGTTSGRDQRTRSQESSFRSVNHTDATR